MQLHDQITPKDVCFARDHCKDNPYITPASTEPVGTSSKGRPTTPLYHITNIRKTPNETENETASRQRIHSYDKTVTSIEILKKF